MRWTLTLAIAALVVVPGMLGSVSAAPAEISLQNAPVQQLRIYQIFEHNKQAFHERFRDQAMPIMARYDFKILGMWEAKTDARTEFVYLLQWPDEATMNDRWKKFLADPEWIAIKKQTAAQYGELVGDVQARTLRMTSYSPRGLDQ